MLPVRASAVAHGAQPSGGRGRPASPGAGEAAPPAAVPGRRDRVGRACRAGRLERIFERPLHVTVDRELHARAVDRHFRAHHVQLTANAVDH
ncbi:MAG: hypothetical protein L0I24_19295, partial [Pseudonocardia sp.]|nr:hypothetical protein [Pseudonocardia sp.]